MRRLSALSLITAFLLALLMPARAGWACPDGTPCVHDQAAGYVCASGQCAAKLSCCEVETARCKHGALPIDEPTSSGHSLGSEEHCRFNVSATTVGEARIAPAEALLVLHPAALPRTVQFDLTRASVTAFRRGEECLGFRPPPIRATGPSRAPPAS